jgi:hypothetical protein
MQGRNLLEVITLGGGVIFIFWLIFRAARALLKRIGISTLRKPEYFFVMAVEADDKNPAIQLVPDGQERLATQPERDDINEKIARTHLISPVGSPAE